MNSTLFMWLDFPLGALHCSLGPLSLFCLVNSTADIMEDDMMFSMEEEGSAKRPNVQQSAPSQRASSLSESASDDEDHFICPILDDSTKDICHYLKNMVYARQLSNSYPKGGFMFKVSGRLGNMMPNGHGW